MGEAETWNIQKRWEEGGEEPKIEAEVWILSHSWPCSTCCSLGANGCVLGQKEDVWGHGSGGSAGTEATVNLQDSEGIGAVDGDRCP